MKEFEMVEEMIANGLSTAVLRQIIGITERQVYNRLADHKWYIHGTRVKELYKVYKAIGEEAWGCIHNQGVYCTDFHTMCDSCVWSEPPKERKQERDPYLKKLDELLCIYPIEELAKMLGVHLSTVLNWERDGGVVTKHRANLQRIYQEHRNDKADERCLYHIGVDCTERNCEKCGWNPEEEERRIRCWVSSLDSSQASV